MQIGCLFGVWARWFATGLLSETDHVALWPQIHTHTETHTAFDCSNCKSSSFNLDSLFVPCSTNANGDACIQVIYWLPLLLVMMMMMMNRFIRFYTSASPFSRNNNRHLNDKKIMEFRVSVLDLIAVWMRGLFFSKIMAWLARLNWSADRANNCSRLTNFVV